MGQAGDPTAEVVLLTTTELGGFNAANINKQLFSASASQFHGAAKVCSWHTLALAASMATTASSQTQSYFQCPLVVVAKLLLKVNRSAYGLQTWYRLGHFVFQPNKLPTNIKLFDYQ